MRRGLSFILAASAVTAVTAVPATARTVRIVNKCSYDVYPAVAPFPNLPEPYKDERGWKAAPETSRDISIPGNFLGRIWGRHGCAQDGDRLNCVTGGCRDVKLACADGEMGGGATSVEFRLRTAQNGEYDVYDLNNGGGWGVPVGVKPVGKNCDSISCTPTLATCPDPKLALKDSYGQILGCASACYGGIGNSDQQCCNGAFAEAAKCTPDLIQFYSYFKEPCRHAYAYYQDSRQGSPTVNFLCKAEDDPGFTVIFCPEGDGDSGPKAGAATSTGRKTKSTGGGVATGNTNESGKIGEPTGTAAAVTQPSDIPAISAVPSLNVTSTNPAEEATAPPAGPTSPPVNASDEAAAATSTAPATATGDATASATDASSAASESAVPEETPGGISKTAMIGVGVGIALVAILGVVVACVVSRRKNAQPTAATTTKSAAAQSSDPEAGHTGGPSAGAGASYNALGRTGSRRRGRQRLLSSSSESDHSSSDDLKGELYSDHSDTSRRARRSASRRSSSRR